MKKFRGGYVLGHLGVVDNPPMAGLRVGSNPKEPYTWRCKRQLQLEAAFSMAVCHFMRSVATLFI
jgi:hypothetical protein